MIDTHCHIDMYADPNAVLKRCEGEGITVIAMSSLPSHFELGYPHVQPFKKIRLSLGMHPLYAEHHNREMDLFFRNLDRTSYIGEIGLDFSRQGYASKDLQLESFEQILMAVSGKKKILSIHSRRAEKEVLDRLKANNIESAIFHWYSGPTSLIEQIVNAGYFFSVNVAMTNSESGRKIISKIPRSALLTESDGPFIPVNGNEGGPWDIEIVEQFLSGIWGMPVEEISRSIKGNFRRLLSILG
ncbi:Qat anti-phage system TatD family nuclease QatD [Pedobacter sp. AJM]|uniref:Qat anti-phage system TatD family nuclease QatD n=1 Tax=Pedobacter sp. AJM TaxID=2003629 RepID=UPI000B4AA46E|nr:Qat anti-phage system TatD family nuclease QatD [Pedobacter sp. AJM]OWK70321.1 TatD family deoxyribonuclease [Pedobacter sp. AJM]